MAKDPHLPTRRAGGTVVFILIVQVVAGLVVLLLSGRSRSMAAEAEAWHLLVGGLVWLVALVHHRLRRSADEEAMDAETLEAAGQLEQPSSAIFETESQDLFTARHRLEQFEKYFLPGFSVLILLALGGLSAHLLKTLITVPAPAEIQDPLLTAVVLLAGAFVTFLLSKYSAGLAAEKAWRPLRPGASYTMSNAMGCLLVGLTQVLNHFETPYVEQVVAYLIAVFMGILAIETLLGLIMAIYRPRLPDQERRVPHDSRVLGILTASGGVLKAAADTLDYQFGFKVSETWFYRFMERALAPLILFQLGAFWLLTCFVVIDAQEEAVIERWGRPLENQQTLKPGLHVKWPWPIDLCRRYPVKRVDTLMIGEQLKEDVDAYLWTVPHAKETFYLLVGNRREESLLKETKGEEETVPVSMLAGTIHVFYRVENLYDYLYTTSDPKATLSTICHRDLARYAVGVDFLEFLGSNRANAATDLKKSFQEHADELRLGVDILEVSLQGVHPPYQAADAFGEVVQHMELKEQLIFEAQGYANKVLPKAEAEAERLRLEASTYKERRTTVVPAEAERFLEQLAAYRRAPRVFVMRELLGATETALAKCRKVIHADWADWDEVTIIDLQEKMLPDFGIELEGAE